MIWIYCSFSSLSLFRDFVLIFDFRFFNEVFGFFVARDTDYYGKRRDPLVRYHDHWCVIEIYVIMIELLD